MLPRVLLFSLFPVLSFAYGSEKDPTELEVTNDDAEAVYNKTYSENYSTLERSLFLRYNPLMRPVRNESERVDVNIHWHLVHAAVNQKEQTINIHGHLYMTWIDEKLGWDPDDFNGIRIARGKKWQVWYPKISIANSVSGVNSVFEISSQAHVLIQAINMKEGAKIEMYPTFSIKAGCMFDYSNFPNDVNQCAVTAYTHDPSDKVNLRIYGPQIPPTVMLAWGKDQKTIISDFEITNVTSQSVWYRQGNISLFEPLTPEEAATSWSMSRLVIDFRRHSALFGVSIVLPSLISFSITVFSFFIVNLYHGVYALTANLIIQAVFLEDLTKTLPMIVENVPKSVAVYGEIMLLNTLAIAIHVGLLSLQGSSTKTPPFFLCLLDFFRPAAVGKLVKSKGEELTWTEAIPLLRPLAATGVVLIFLGGYIVSMIF